MSLLLVDGLGVEFRTRDGVVRALEGVGFGVAEGEIVGVVGESGSGKSVTAQALLRILEPAGRVVAGTAAFGGVDLLSCPEAAMRMVRGRQIGMVFQNPRGALNPVVPVGRQIEDVLVHAGGMARRAARGRAIELLAEVRISDPARRAAALPMQLSGGMCQRVMMAVALAGRPRLLIADEPTTGLDVTTQAAVMALLAREMRERGMALLLITHDLALAGEHCDRVVVMHAGHVVEEGPVGAVLGAPQHPYTQRLVATMPQGKADVSELLPIAGGLPDLRGDLLPCRYALRCERHVPACDVGVLARVAVGPGHDVACRFPG